MGLICLIRHGQASFGAADYDRLSETGERQSTILAEYFSSSGVVFDSVFTGAMRRQKDTAAIAMKNAPGCFLSAAPVEIHELDEHESGDIIKAQLPGMIAENPALSEDVKLFFKDARAFRRLFTIAMLRWAAGRHDAPGLESFADFNSRVARGLNKVLQGDTPDRKAAVFTSGGVIASIVQSALALPYEKAVRLPWWIRNASVTVFRHEADNLDLLCFNSAAYLEIEKEPELLTYK